MENRRAACRSGGTRGLVQGCCVPSGCRVRPRDRSPCLDDIPAGGWCWVVHCETSTGSSTIFGSRVAVRGTLDPSMCRLRQLDGTIPMRLDGVISLRRQREGVGGLPGLSIYSPHPGPPSTAFRALDLAVRAARWRPSPTRPISSRRYGSRASTPSSRTVREMARSRMARDELRSLGYTSSSEAVARRHVTLELPEGASARVARRTARDARFRAELQKRLPPSAKLDPISLMGGARVSGSSPC